MDLKYEKDKKRIEEEATRCDKEETSIIMPGCSEGQLLKSKRFKPRRISPRGTKQISRFNEEYQWQE